MKNAFCSKVWASFTLALFALLAIGCVSTKVSPTQSEEGEEQSVCAATKGMSEDEFIDFVSSVVIKVTKNPCEGSTIIKNKAFPAPYVLSVTNNLGAVKGLSITASYPTARDNDIILYTSVNLTTDDNGQASFMPQKSPIAVNDEVTFYPTPISSRADVTQSCFDRAATATFIVKSDYVGSPGGILYVFDYNERGSPTRNNFALLRNLRNAGVNAGNAPISDERYLKRNAHELYEACKPIVKGEANFLIYGAFKYVASNGSAVTLQADIECLDMATGETLYKTSATESATGKDKLSADNECREKLASILAQSVMYSM